VEAALDYRWSADKDAWLRAERGVGFEELVAAIEAGGLLGDAAHPQIGRFGHQRVFWVRLRGQVWLIPYVMENGHGCFLKTAYPSRKAAKRLRGGQDAQA
jgi:hypothetical protein